MSLQQMKKFVTEATKIVKDYEEKVKNKKKEFQMFLTNPDIDFKDRLRAFVDAPIELKFHSDWLPSRGEGQIEKVWERIFDSCADSGNRGQHVEIQWQIEEPLYAYLDLEEYDYEDKYSYFDDEEHLIEFCEHIMKQNLGSFTFDW